MKSTIAIVLIYALMVFIIVNSVGCSVVQPQVKVVEIKKETPLCTMLEPEPVKTQPRPNMETDDEEFIEYLMELVAEYAERAGYRLQHNNACVKSLQ